MHPRSTEPNVGSSNLSGRADLALDNRAQDRFWAKVDRSGGPVACWPWTAGTGSGYGRFNVGAGKTEYAHRLACHMAHGAPPRTGLDACHSRECTTRRCCNGTHLRWDTRAANIGDALAIGKMRGEKCARATLTAAQASEVWSRSMAGDAPTAIAMAMGLTIHAVSAIVRGRTWTHVTGAPRYEAGRGGGRVRLARLAVAASMLLEGRGPGGVT